MCYAPISIVELRQHLKRTAWTLKRLSNDYKSCSANCTSSMNFSAEGGDQNSTIGAVSVEIFRELVVHDNFAIITRRRSVHEVQDAIARAQRQPHMCG